MWFRCLSSQQILHYLMTNGYCKNGAPMCFQLLLLNDFLRHVYLTFTPGFHSFAGSQKCHWWNCMPYATSKIVPNSMPTTPLPGAIAERFQFSVTYIFSSHKWKFENRKCCLNCQYSPTENTMLDFRSANTVFIEVYINLSFDHRFRSETMT